MEYRFKMVQKKVASPFRKITGSEGLKKGLKKLVSAKE